MSMFTSTKVYQTSLQIGPQNTQPNFSKYSPCHLPTIPRAVFVILTYLLHNTLYKRLTCCHRLGYTGHPRRGWWLGWVECSGLLSLRSGGWGSWRQWIWYLSTQSGTLIRWEWRFVPSWRRYWSWSSQHTKRKDQCKVLRNCPTSLLRKNVGLGEG